MLHWAGAMSRILIFRLKSVLGAMIRRHRTANTRPARAVVPCSACCAAKLISSTLSIAQAVAPPGVLDLLGHPDQVLGRCRCRRYEAEGQVGNAHCEAPPIKMRAASPAPDNAAAFGCREDNQQAALRRYAHPAKHGGTRPDRGMRISAIEDGHDLPRAAVQLMQDAP